MRKGEIACYKQFLLFSKCFPQLHIFNVSKWGISSLMHFQMSAVSSSLDQSAILSSGNGLKMTWDDLLTGGQKALESAKTVQHFKVVADLIKKGADTSHFSMKSGDTPIHAIVSLVLEKEKKGMLDSLTLSQTTDFRLFQIESICRRQF